MTGRLEHRSSATVPTAKPTPYVKQLCKHFRHKLEVNFDDARGEIHFDFGRCRLETSEGALVLVAEAADEPRLERVEQVIADHLERFGRRDELSVIWVRQADR